MADQKSGSSKSIKFTLTDKSVDPAVAIDLSAMSDVFIFLRTAGNEIIEKYSMNEKEGFNNTDFEDLGSGQVRLYVQYDVLEKKYGQIYAEVVVEQSDVKFPSGKRIKSLDSPLFNALKSVSDGN